MTAAQSDPNVPKSGPKDVFMHLMVFVALYVSVVGFIALLFQYINYWQPDPLSFYYDSVINAIRWSASVLFVMYPVYILVSWMINKELNASPEKKNLKIRKWLTYLTLFASALTVIIDVITLIYNYLGGDLTLSFFLKIAVVLLTASAVFGYYLWDLRKDTDRKKVKMLAWLVSLVVLAAIVGGFFVVGTPSQQRQRRFDQQRVNDLQILQSEVVNYWNQKNVLPSTLAELKSSISGFIPPKDPETARDYEYSKKSALAFELCAVFNQSSVETNAQSRIKVPYYDSYNQNWSHAAGRVCFERTIDPQRDMQPLPVK